MNKGGKILSGYQVIVSAMLAVSLSIAFQIFLTTVYRPPEAGSYFKDGNYAAAMKGYKDLLARDPAM